MKNKLKRFKWFVFNIFTMIVNIFIRRDKRIWLFGAWMGDKFADNSRFLFQYIQENLETSHIEKVMWVTRNINVFEKLTKEGYTVYMCGTRKSRYAHLKAGVHIVCNMYDNVSDYSGDIDGRFSWGARKIQLWHGVGIKACGNLKNNNKNKALYKLRKMSVFFPGGWNKCYWLVTSKENGRVAIEDHGAYNERKLIYSSYPRFNDVIKFIGDEKTIIDNIIEKRKNKYKIVMYLPTFRSNYDFFKKPTKIEGFIDNLLKNKIIWVEKKHSASRLDNTEEEDNMLILNPEFDINVLYDYCDLVVTDYSSAVTDAIAKNIRTLNYIPDYDYYCDEDRGFVNDFELYNPGIIVKDEQHLILELNDLLFKQDFNVSMDEKYIKTKKFLIDDKKDDYYTIVEKIRKIIE